MDVGLGADLGSGSARDLREEVARSLTTALRWGATPLLLGLRWAQREADACATSIPSPRGGLAQLSKVLLDEFFFATELASAPLVSPFERRRVTRETADAAALYARRGWLEQPQAYHRAPPPLEEASYALRRTRGLRYAHLRFESGWAPHADEPGRGRWLAYAANRTAHAWLLQHPGPPRPWLVCVPGYRMGHPLVDFAGFGARWLHGRLGLNVAIPVMPLHGPRREGRRGGDGFFTGDFMDTVHAQAQAVWDVRRVVSWLRRQGAPAVGVHGVSLGGMTAALLAALEDDLDCVVAGVPASDFLRLVRAHAPAFVLRAATRAGFCFETVGRVLRVVSPLAMPPRVAHARRFLYAGLADRLASPDHAHALWDHWGRPRLAWYEGSHVSFLWEADVRALLQEALCAGGLLPEPLAG